MDILCKVLELIYFLILFLAAFIDVKTSLIPDWCTVSIVFCGIGTFFLRGAGLVKVLGSFVVMVICLFVFWKDRGEQIGGGDLKLIGASSLVLSLPELLFGLFLSAVLAAGIEGSRFLFKKGRSVFPMGPYLLVGFFISYVVS